MKGLISLAYTVAVDKLIKERERRKKVNYLKNELAEINKYILKSKIPPTKKKTLSRKISSFSSEVERYPLEKLDNVEESIETIKLGAKVVNYLSNSKLNRELVKGLESVVSKIEFTEFVDSDDFKYSFISSVNNLFYGNDYILKSFRNTVLNDLLNEVKFEKLVYSAVRNFSTAPTKYFLDSKLRNYKLKKKVRDGNSITMYFSHGKTIKVVKSNRLLIDSFDDDVTVYVVPQLNDFEKEVVKNYYSDENVFLAYSVEDNKFYYNAHDARALYFVEYFKGAVPPNSEELLARVSKKRGVYAAPELGVSEAILPLELDNDLWR